MKREQAIHLMTNEPYKIGHLLGFTKLTELHNVWLKDMILGTEDELLQAHRGAFKTTCVSLALALLIVLQPSKRILFIRKSENDIKEIVYQVQKILKDERFKYLVKMIYDIDLALLTESATEVSTNLSTDIKGSAQLTGFGIGSSLTGKHYDYIFTDDIVNLDDRVSKAEREKTKRVYQELHNLLNAGGRIFNTGTPWHKDDAFILMPEPKRYDCYSTGLMTEEQIQEKKDSMTPSMFSANYELRHIASEDVIFSNPQYDDDASKCKDGIMHIDSAFDGEDWTAVSIIAKRGEKYFVFGKTWRKHIKDCYEDIIGLYGQFLASKVYSETNADKGYVLMDLKRIAKTKNILMRTRPYAETMNKYLKIATYLKGAWQNVIFVKGTDEAYIQQILEYNENADHDDCPDSLASGIRQLYRK